MTTDRDPAVLEVLERLTPRLPDYPHDWEDVLERARPGRSRRGAFAPRRRFAVAIAVLATAVAVALGVTTPWTHAPGIIDKHIVARAEAALTLPAGTVLHMKWEDAEAGNPTTTTFEIWLGHDGLYHGFVTDGATGQRVEIGGTEDLRRSVEYDPRTNAIGTGLVNGMSYSIGDDVAVLRKELAKGMATADGETTIDGQRVARIRLHSIGLDCKPVVDYLFVDPKTFYPVEYRVTVFASRGSTTPHVTYARAPLVRRFRTFERLPATPANRRLTSITALHPTAKVYATPTTRPPVPPCATNP
jgi:hypothetical protein